MNSNLSTSSQASRLSARQILTVVATSVGFVVSQLDVSIVNVTLSSIGRDLHASVASLQWTVDSYALAFSALMLSAGSLGDRFGARRLFGGGLALFALASLLCAFSRDAAQLVAARAIQGVSAAAMLPNSLALLNAACGDDRGARARAVGLWTAAGSISIASGPIVGGLLIAAFGGRSIFWVNVPLCAAGIVATLAWIDDAKPHRTGDAPAHAGGVDLPGQLFAVVALTAFGGAVIEMRPLGIAHLLVIGGMLLACASAAAFVATERRTRAPILPLSLFAERTFSAAVVFVLSLYLQRVLGHTPLQTGLAFLPLTGGFLLKSGERPADRALRLTSADDHRRAARRRGLRRADVRRPGNANRRAAALPADSVRHGRGRPGDDHRAARHGRSGARG